MNTELIRTNLEDLDAQVLAGDVPAACRTALLVAKLLLTQDVPLEPGRALYGAYAGVANELSGVFEKMESQFRPLEDMKKIRTRIQELDVSFQERQCAYQEDAQAHKELLEKEEALRGADARLTELRRRIAELDELKAGLEAFSPVWAEDRRLVEQLPDSIGDGGVDAQIQHAKESLRQLQSSVDAQEESLRTIIQKIQALYASPEENG